MKNEKSIRLLLTAYGSEAYIPIYRDRLPLTAYCISSIFTSLPFILKIICIFTASKFETKIMTV